MKKLLSLTLAALMLTSLFAGCTPKDNSGASKDPNSGNTAEPNTVKDTLTIAVRADCGDMNPHGLTSNDYVKIKIQCYETLIYQTFDGELQPQLATEWKWIDDTTLELKLREGVKFHNGETMTAEDVIFSLQEVSKSSASYPVEEIDWGKSGVVDDYTVRLVTKIPFRPLVSNLTYFPTAIFSKKGFEDNGGDFNKADIGTGPYIFSDWVESDHVTQTAFADYWGGEPAIKTINWKVIADDSSRAIELETGGCDLAYVVSQLDVPNLESTNGITVEKYYTNDENTVHFNMDLEKFQNETLRKAFAYSFDREKITQIAWKGATVSTDLFLDPNHPMAFKTADEVKAAGGDVIEFNLDKAKELFAEAGYANGGTFQVATGPNTSYIASAVAWGADLAKIGINIDIVSFDRATYINDMKVARNFEICFWGTAPLNGDFDYFARHYYGGSPATLNISQSKDSAFDALVEKYDQEQDDVKAAEYAKEAQLLLYDGYYSIPICQTADIFARIDSLKGFTDGSYQSPVLKNCYFE